jgi:mannose-6-phosphate isomerase-like protein (cupin superfamily)
MNKRIWPALGLALVAAAAQSASTPLLVRNGPPWSPAEPRMVMTAAEFAAHHTRFAAEARAGRRYDPGPVVMQGRYRAQLEWRNAPQLGANVHEKDAELFVVIAGSGTMLLGGTLVNPRVAGPNRWEGRTLIGQGMPLGATPRRVAKGDVILIPAGMAHSVSEVQGTLSIWTMHLPDPGPNPPPLPEPEPDYVPPPKP